MTLMCVTWTITTKKASQKRKKKKLRSYDDLCKLKYPYARLAVAEESLKRTRQVF